MAATIVPQQPQELPQQPPAPTSTAELTEPLPNAAQIPLDSFKLPDFPPQAAHLQALTLTSDIKPTDYSDQLTTALDPEVIPSSFPRGIEALTLELFSLGYPPPFLAKLARALPKLKTLTLYSQLVDGVGDGSRRDAGEFFNDVLVGRKENGGGLRELHLIDTFSRKGFIAGLGAILEDLNTPDPGTGAPRKSMLRFLEIAYTYRGHSDSNFLSRIPGEEIPTMLVPGLMAASFSLAAPPTTSSDPSSSEFPEDPADVDENGVPIPGRKPEGIIPLPQSNPGTAILVRKLTGGVVEDNNDEKAVVTKKDADKGREKEEEEEEEDVRPPGSGPGPQNLKMLDSTIYTLDTTQLADIVRFQKGLAVLSASVLVGASETAKAALLEALRGGKGDGDSGTELEIVEIVGVPDAEFDKEVSASCSIPIKLSISLSTCLANTDF